MRCARSSLLINFLSVFMGFFIRKFFRKMNGVINLFFFITKGAIFVVFF